MKIKFTIFLFLSLLSCQNQEERKSIEYRDLVQNIENLIDDDFNGVILLKKDSSVIYSNASGYSDLEKKLSLQLSDQFVIGSISKQITAVLVLREYEKGKLKLDDKLNKYLDKIKQPWAKDISIHHLLTHTHGIIDIDKDLAFEQGSQFEYSQLGYDLLAQILEKTSGKSFLSLSQELFKSEDLNNTFHPNKQTYKHLVKGYVENQTGILEFSAHSLYNYAAAGSFISNAEDLARWNQLLHTGKLVKSKTLDLMKTRYETRIHPIFDKVEYGYGLLFSEDENDIQIGALGYAPGFVSASYYYPQSNMNLIILENTARYLGDFKQTFKTHTQIMSLVKEANKKTLNK